MLLFSEAIRDARKHAGFSRQKLAEAIEATPRAVQSWEQGRREPSWATGCAIAGACGGFILLHADGPMFEPSPLNERGSE